jgi:hypothetical protein
MAGKQMRFLVNALTAGVICIANVGFAGTETINFSINRSAVPSLYFNELTLMVKACGATSATVMAGTTTVPDTIVNDYVIFSTSANSVTVTLNGTTTTTGVGTFKKAPLKDNKKWAWSHSLDDNSSLSDEIAAFKTKGYRGLSFLIGSSAGSGDISTGWSFGNHSYSHNYASSIGDSNAVKADIRQAQTKLNGLISSVIPGYKVIAFAAPMFDGAFGPIIRSMRKTADTDLQFCESGNNYKLHVDSGAGTFGSFIGFSYTFDIGRWDFCNTYPNNTPDYPTWKLTVDWMHTNMAETRHFWFNTFNHGGEDNNNLVPKAVNYVDSAYANRGSKEAWIAPSDEVYSYILVRDKTVVTNDRTGIINNIVSSLITKSMSVRALGSKRISLETSRTGMVRIYNLNGGLVSTIARIGSEKGTAEVMMPSNGSYLVSFESNIGKEVIPVFVR